MAERDQTTGTSQGHLDDEVRARYRLHAATCEHAGVDHSPVAPDADQKERSAATETVD